MIDQFTAKARQGKVGSSDVPAICGHDDFRSAYDVWAQMTGRVPGFKGNEATEAGSYFEPALINWLGDRLGCTISRDQFFIHPDDMRCANLDGLILHGSEPGIVEAKTTGLIHATSRVRKWTDEADGADGIPEEVLLQVHHQFAVLDAHDIRLDLAHVVAFIGGRGFAHYRVRRNETLVEAISLRAVRFMVEHVRADIPPEGGPSMDVAKAMTRVTGKSVDISLGVMADWLAAKEVARAARDYLKIAEENEEASRSIMVGAMGDAEAAVAPAGTIFWKEYERVGYTVQPTKYKRLIFKEDKRYIEAAASVDGKLIGGAA